MTMRIQLKWFMVVDMIAATGMTLKPAAGAGAITELRIAREERDNHQTSLMWSAENGFTALITARMGQLTPNQRVTEINRVDTCGVTALICAAYRGQVGAIRTLMDYLTPEQRVIAINQQIDNSGVTALMWAAHNGYAGVIRTLMDYLTPEQRVIAINHTEGSRGATALMWAAEKGYTNVVELLNGYLDDDVDLDNDVDVDAGNSCWWRFCRRITSRRV